MCENRSRGIMQLYTYINPHNPVIDNNSVTINARNIVKAIARKIELFRYERPDGLINARVRREKNVGR